MGDSQHNQYGYGQYYGDYQHQQSQQQYYGQPQQNYYNQQNSGYPPQQEQQSYQYYDQNQSQSYPPSSSYQNQQQQYYPDQNQGYQPQRNDRGGRDNRRDDRGGGGYRNDRSDRHDRGGGRDRDYGGRRDDHRGGGRRDDRDNRGRGADRRDNRDNIKGTYRDKDYRHSKRSRSRDRRSRSRDRKDKDVSFEILRDRSRTPPRLRKRASYWDIAPTGFETGSVQIGQHVPVPPNLHSTRQSKRIYVGNIPPTISELEIAEFFNTALFTAGVTVNNNPSPVLAVQMNREKAFAFLEFATHDDASAAMGFDGITLQGNSLKVRRPKDWTPAGFVSYEPTPGEDLAAPNLPNIVSTNVAEGPNKIFVGGLPSYLNEEQVKQLIGTFGQLRSFNLVKDNQTGISKGFAFYEYLDPNITDRACQGLNGMKIGEKTILVQRANVGAKQASSAPSSTNQIALLSNPTAYNFLNLGMPIAAAAALLTLNINDSGAASRILLIINMVGPEDLYNDNEYKDIVDDISSELKKYGTVLSITIPRPPPPKPKADDFNIITANTLPTEIHWGVGKVFIEFSKKEEAKKAHGILSGRKFNGRTCVTGFYSEEKYAAKDFLPDPEEEKAVAERYKKEREEKDKIEIEKARQEALEEIAEMEMLEKMNQEADAREQREREQKEREQQQEQ